MEQVNHPCIILAHIWDMMIMTEANVMLLVSQKITNRRVISEQQHQELLIQIGLVQLEVI